MTPSSDMFQTISAVLSNIEFKDVSVSLEYIRPHLSKLITSTINENYH